MAWRCLEQPYLSTQKNVWYVEDDLSGDWGCNCCNLLIKSYKKNRTWGLVNRIYWDYQPPSGMMLQVQYENLLTNIGQIYVVIQLKKNMWFILVTLEVGALWHGDSFKHTWFSMEMGDVMNIQLDFSLIPRCWPISIGRKRNLPIPVCFCPAIWGCLRCT